MKAIFKLSESAERSNILLNRIYKRYQTLTNLAVILNIKYDICNFQLFLGETHQFNLFILSFQTFKKEMADLFIALPPVTKNAVIFGKNANLPPTDVQQVIYCAAANHATGSKVKVYLTKSKLQKMFHYHMTTIILLYS